MKWCFIRLFGLKFEFLRTFSFFVAFSFFSSVSSVQFISIHSFRCELDFRLISFIVDSTYLCPFLKCFSYLFEAQISDYIHAVGCWASNERSQRQLRQWVRHMYVHDQSIQCVSAISAYNESESSVRITFDDIAHCIKTKTTWSHLLHVSVSVLLFFPSSCVPIRSWGLRFEYKHLIHVSIIDFPQ